MKYRRTVVIDYASWWMRPAMAVVCWWSRLRRPDTWKNKPMPSWVRFESRNGHIEVVE